jgi:hypothetical protein
MSKINNFLRSVFRLTESNTDQYQGGGIEASSNKDTRALSLAPSERQTNELFHNIASNITSNSKGSSSYGMSLTTAETNRALWMIKDSGVRAAVREKLQIVARGGNVGVQAAVDLSEMAKGGRPEADNVYNALEMLVKETGFSGNASMRLALARAKLDRLPVVIGPLSPEHPKMIRRTIATKEVNNLTWDAIKLVAARDIMTGKRQEGAKVDRREAELVNRYAAQIFRSIGDEFQAGQCEKKARLYAATDEDRKGAIEGELMSKWEIKGDKAASMRGINGEERRLRERTVQNQKDLDNVFKTHAERTIDANENDTKYAVPDTDIKSSYGTATSPIYIPENGSAAKGNKQKFRYTPNQAGSRAGGAAVKSVDAFNELGKWITVSLRMHFSTPLIQEKLQLQKALKEELTVIVPPKPENLDKVKELIKDLIQYSNDPKVHAYANEVYNQVVEYSYAYWNK